MASAVAIIISCKNENLSTESAPLASSESISGAAIPGKYIVVLKGEPALKGMPNAVREKVLALLTKN